MFLIDILKGENLSKKAKEKRDAFIKRIKDVKARYERMDMMYDNAVCIVAVCKEFLHIFLHCNHYMTKCLFFQLPSGFQGKT